MQFPDSIAVNSVEARDVTKDGEESAKAAEVETVTVDDLLNIPLPQEDDVTAEPAAAEQGAFKCRSL